MIDRWVFLIINSDDTKPCPKAIKHGEAMEPAAKQHYIRMMKGNHTNFHAQDCGILKNSALQNTDRWLCSYCS